jgi:hypothetical protein
MGNAEINGNLILSGATLSSLDLDSAWIKGTILMGVNRQPYHEEKRVTTWIDDAKIDLSRGKLRVLPILNSYWPKNIMIAGLQYDDLDVIQFSDDDEPVIRDTASERIKWLTEWLGKQPDPSGPYIYMRKTLLTQGRRDEGDSVGYAGRKRELNNFWKTGQYWSVICYGILGIIAGFGYHLWISSLWIIGFVLIGTMIFMTTNEAKEGRYRFGLAASFDYLIPVIHLREKHYNVDFSGWQRYYFYIHRIMGFILSGIIGAALSGLIQ